MREVAELPDVVLAPVRSKRKVPSVQQLNQLVLLEAEPQPRPLSQRPPDPVFEVTSSASDPEEMRHSSSEVGAGTEGCEEDLTDPEEVEEQLESTLCNLKLLQIREPHSEPSRELTHCSAFDLEDSLVYTMDDGETFTGDVHESSQREVVPHWGVAEEEDVEEEEDSFENGALQLTAKLDPEGLLCDAGAWREEVQTARDQVTQPEASEDFHIASGDAQEEVQSHANASGFFTSAAQPAEAANLALHPVVSHITAKKALDPQVKIARLSAQIARLYADVVRDLDAPARAVWDELYKLFQAKMAVDLTDEDQCEIERYVFEQLPTESTDLIWKVYKVLHLEQERDRCQRMVESTLVS